MGLVHVVLKQPSLGILFSTLVTFHKVLGRMNISYVVLELLKGSPTVRASLLHVEVDRPMVRCTVASLTKSLQKLRFVSFWGQLGQFVLMKLLCLIFSKRHTIAKQCQQIVNPLPPPKNPVSRAVIHELLFDR